MADSGERAQSAFSTTRMVAAQGLPSGRACTALADGVGIVLNREEVQSMSTDVAVPGGCDVPAV